MNRKIIQAFELEGNGNPLRYPCLGNPMDRGAWRATVHGSHGLKWLNKQLYLYVSMYVCMCVCVCKTLNLSAVYLKYNFVNQLYSKKKKKGYTKVPDWRKVQCYRAIFIKVNFKNIPICQLWVCFQKLHPFSPSSQYKVQPFYNNNKEKPENIFLGYLLLNYLEHWWVIFFWKWQIWGTRSGKLKGNF